MNKINLAEKFASFDETWTPRIVGELNGQYVKVVKCKGAYVWHHHDYEDEMFLVIRGGLTIFLRDRAIELKKGEFCIVPRGVEHKPVADDSADVVLIEPTSTRNTGNVDHEYTIEPADLEHI